jgi:hypothetical protein
MTEQKLHKKGGATGLKDSRFSKRYCRDCPEVTVHSTGSQLWVSCPYQPGWRDINSICNLPEEKEDPKR